MTDDTRRMTERRPSVRTSVAQRPILSNIYGVDCPGAWRYPVEQVFRRRDGWLLLRLVLVCLDSSYTPSHPA